MSSSRTAGRGHSGSNPYLPHSQRNHAVPLRKKGVAPPVQIIGGVPVGTSVQIQEWVDDDPARAKLAWDRERGESRPRVTLLNYLNTVLRRGGDLPQVGAAPSVAVLELEAGDDAVLSLPVGAVL